MNELIIKIKKELETKIEELEQRLDELQNKNYTSTYDKVNTFINEYEKQGNFNISLLQSFYDEVDNSKLMDIAEYQDILNAILEIKSINDNGIFDNDILKLTEKLKQTILSCKHISNELLNKIKNNGYDKRVAKNDVLKLREIALSLESLTTNNVISSDSLALIYDFIRESCQELTQDEKISLSKYLCDKNVSLMDSIIKKAVLRENVKKKQEELVKEQSQVREEQKPEVIKPLNFEEWLKSKVSDKEYNLYLKTMDLINGNFNSSNMTDMVMKVLEKSGKNKPLEERLALYKTLSDYKSQKYLMIMDIKDNIIEAMIANYQEDKLNLDLFAELELMLEEYIKVDKQEQEQLKESKFDYEKLLKELNKKEELMFLGELDDLIHKVALKSEKDKSFKVTASQFVEQLLSKKMDYIESLRMYDESKSLETLSLSEEIYRELAEPFVQLQKVYEDYTYSNPNEVNDLEQLGKDFYNSADKFCNVIVFPTPTSSVVSEIEEDIERDSSITEKGKGYVQALDKLRMMVSTDYVSESNKEDNHRVKSDKYSNEFLKEFRVKNERNGEVRIFYSQFSTTLGQIISHDGKFNLGVLFVHEIAYGDTDGSKKSDINIEALDRCYKNRDEIRKILALFNTKWDKLSEEERSAAQAEVNACLQKNEKQLGHFIMKKNEVVAKEGVLS